MSISGRAESETIALVLNHISFDDSVILGVGEKLSIGKVDVDDLNI